MFVGARAPIKVQPLFVGITTIISTTTPMVWPANTQAGDIAICSGVGTSLLSHTGWSGITGAVISGSTISFMYKVLVAGDITSPPSITVPTSGGYFCAVFRGPTVLTKKNETVGAGSSVNITGFVRSGSSKFVICTQHDRDGIGPLPAPTKFIKDAADQTTNFAHVFSHLRSNEYNQGVVNAPLTANTFDGAGTLLELT